MTCRGTRLPMAEVFCFLFILSRGVEVGLEDHSRGCLIPRGGHVANRELRNQSALADRRGDTCILLGGSMKNKLHLVGVLFRSCYNNAG